MSKEKWKRINNYEDYFISSWGRVYSSKSKQLLNGYFHKSKGNTYKRVCLNNNKKFFIHVLVAEHFHTVQKAIITFLNPNSHLIVEHLDTNTLNNNQNNVKWDTQSNNIRLAHARNIKNIFNELGELIEEGEANDKN